MKQFSNAAGLLDRIEASPEALRRLEALRATVAAQERDQRSLATESLQDVEFVLVGEERAA